MTRSFALAAIASFALLPTTAMAQMSANPAMDAVKAQFGMAKNPVTRTAAKVPEELYSFKPTPEVRSLGQLIGHIADANFSICGAAGGETPPAVSIEKTKTSKADLSQALADSFAFCHKIIAAMDDKKGMEMIKFFTGPIPRMMVLAFNNSHNNEYYGNLVTYMRLKGIVPPSSEPAK